MSDKISKRYPSTFEFRFVGVSRHEPTQHDKKIDYDMRVIEIWICGEILKAVMQYHA